MPSAKNKPVGLPVKDKGLFGLEEHIWQAGEIPSAQAFPAQGYTEDRKQGRQGVQVACMQAV